MVSLPLAAVTIFEDKSWTTWIGLGSGSCVTIHLLGLLRVVTFGVLWVSGSTICFRPAGGLSKVLASFESRREEEKFLTLTTSTARTLTMKRKHQCTRNAQNTFPAILFYGVSRRIPVPTTDMHCFVRHYLISNDGQFLIKTYMTLWQCFVGQLHTSKLTIASVRVTEIGVSRDTLLFRTIVL